MTATALDIARGGVGGDAVEPGGKRRVAAELSDALPGPQVCVLHHVARVLLVAGEATRECERVDEGASHQLVERPAVTATGGANQLGLVQPDLLMPSRFDPAPPGKVTRRAAPSGSHPIGLTRLLVDGVALVPAAVLLHLDALAVVDLALHRDVVAPLAVLAGERDLDPLLVLRHFYSLALCGARYVRRGRSLAGEFARVRSLTASENPDSTPSHPLFFDFDDAAGADGA